MLKGVDERSEVGGIRSTRYEFASTFCEFVHSYRMNPPPFDKGGMIWYKTARVQNALLTFLFILSFFGKSGNHKIPLDKCEQMCYNIENEPGGETMGELNTPIDVISVCAADGSIKPLRFRMEDAEHKLRRIDIDQVISTRKIQYVGIEAHIFLCRAVVEGQEWLFELKYTIRTHCWTLFRRIL